MNCWHLYFGTSWYNRIVNQIVTSCGYLQMLLHWLQYISSSHIKYMYIHVYIHMYTSSNRNKTANEIFIRSNQRMLRDAIWEWLSNCYPLLLLSVSISWESDDGDKKSKSGSLMKQTFLFDLYFLRCHCCMCISISGHIAELFCHENQKYPVTRYRSVLGCPKNHSWGEAPNKDVPLTGKWWT